MWTCWKALILTLFDVMINCNCFNDRDYSLLVFNEVYDSYLKLWMNCYFSIRNHMTIYICCCYKNDHDALMSVFYFYRHLYLQTCGHIFRFQLSLEDKRGLSLGSWYVHFASCFYIDIYRIMDWYFTLITILMAILSYFTRFI